MPLILTFNPPLLTQESGREEAAPEAGTGLGKQSRFNRVGRAESSSARFPGPSPGEKLNRLLPMALSAGGHGTGG